MTISAAGQGRMRNNCRLVVIAFVLVAPACAANQQRQADVSARGAEVMPFQLDATIHIFTKTTAGGMQRVIAKDAHDAAETERVRRHLREIQTQFMRGDFSGPSHVHGTEMPGLATLKAAKPGEIVISYRHVEGGAELNYKTLEPRLVEALHRWFDAQLADHGPDAMEGHSHHQMDGGGHHW